MSGPRRRVWDGAKWAGADGVPDYTPPGNTSRDALVPMVDKPGPTNTGVYSGTTFVDVVPGSGNVITITQPGIYTAKTYWGQFRATVEGVVLRNCEIAGPDPNSFPGLVKGDNPSGNNLGVVQNYGSAPKVIEMWDCTLDPGLWLTARAPGGARAKLNLFCTGWHGGQARLYRCNITNIQDGVNFLGPSTLAAAKTSEFLMQQCWVHKGTYGNNVYNSRVADGQPHADGFQTNYGRNFTLRGNTIGGNRDHVGYNDWATGPTWPFAYSSNTGDDFWNAGILIQQEVGWTSGGDDTDYRNICNGLIEGNWLGGSNCTLNISSLQSRPNPFTTVTIRNNKFLARQTNWGKKMRGDAQDTPGYDASSTGSPGGLGWAVLKGGLYNGPMSGNVWENSGPLATAGTAVTITNGGIN